MLSPFVGTKQKAEVADVKQALLLIFLVSISGCGQIGHSLEIGAGYHFIDSDGGSYQGANSPGSPTSAGSFSGGDLDDIQSIYAAWTFHFKPPWIDGSRQALAATTIGLGVPDGLDIPKDNPMLKIGDIEFDVPEDETGNLWKTVVSFGVLVCAVSLFEFVRRRKKRNGAKE